MAKCVDHDQMLQSVLSNLDLHCQSECLEGIGYKGNVLMSPIFTQIGRHGVDYIEI